MHISFRFYNRDTHKLEMFAGNIRAFDFEPEEAHGIVVRALREAAVAYQRRIYLGVVKEIPIMPVSKANVDDVFQHHPPRPDQMAKHEAVRAGAVAFANVILDNTETCGDQQAALRSVREAMMTANAAIALDGKI